jgi:hypothetical protein
MPRMRWCFRFVDSHTHMMFAEGLKVWWFAAPLTRR